MLDRSMAPSKKTMLFVCLLVAAVAVGVPVAQGTLDLGGIIGTLLGLFRIQGTLFCSANLSVNGTSPPLANATVQLRCGAGNGTLVGSVQTNSQGQFSILADPLFITLTQLLSGCRVVVATPVVGCNATLPIAGILSSTLTLAGNTISGLLTIINLIPRGFTVTLQ